MALKDKYLTISEAAKEMDVTRQSLSRWIRGGTLKAEKIGRETLIERKDLAKIRMTRLADTFDEAIIRGFIHDIRRKGKYKESDKITHKGNLVFEIEKKDGSRDIADVHSFSIEPEDIKIVPFGEFKEKGEYKE